MKKIIKLKKMYADDPSILTYKCKSAKLKPKKANKTDLYKAYITKINREKYVIKIQPNLTFEEFYNAWMERPCFTTNKYAFNRNYKVNAWVMIKPNQDAQLSITNLQIVQLQYIFTELGANEFENKTLTQKRIRGMKNRKYKTRKYKPHTKKHKDKIAKALNGIKRSKKTKLKMKMAAIKRWASNV